MKYCWDMDAAGAHPCKMNAATNIIKVTNGLNRQKLLQVVVIN